MWLKTQIVRLKDGDKTLKFYLCQSFRDPGSRRPKYRACYLGSMRLSRMLDTNSRILFWTKFRMRVTALGIPEECDYYELLRVMVHARFERVMYP